MNSTLQIFNKDNFTVRTINKNGTIWFVAKDVAQALDYSEATISNMEKTIAHVPEMWKGRERIPTLGGEQEMLCLSEQGLYFFLGRSDKPKAIPYQIWIAGDVVPSIRQTGKYITKSNEDELKAKNKELDIRAAELLKSMLDMPHMTAESKAVFSHEIYRLISGHENLAMLPEATEARHTATKIGKMFSVTANRIGRVAIKYGLKSKQGAPSEYGRWICDKSRYSSHECMTFVYNDKAVAWFKAHEDLLHSKQRRK